MEFCSVTAAEWDVPSRGHRPNQLIWQSWKAREPIRRGIKSGEEEEEGEGRGKDEEMKNKGRGSRSGEERVREWRGGAAKEGTEGEQTGGKVEGEREAARRGERDRARLQPSN